jgi:hypothetical protein
LFMCSDPNLMYIIHNNGSHSYLQRESPVHWKLDHFSQQSDRA